jgi:hypothetical protein
MKLVSSITSKNKIRNNVAIVHITKKMFSFVRNQLNSIGYIRNQSTNSQRFSYNKSSCTNSLVILAFLPQTISN